MNVILAVGRLLDLNEERDRRLAFRHRLKELGVVGVALWEIREPVGELQQELQPIGHGEGKEVLADSHERLRKFGELRRCGVRHAPILPHEPRCNTHHMPVVESSVVVPLEPDLAFAVSQTTGSVRLRWDPFIHRQHFLDGATVPAKGVRTYTQHRSRVSMVSEYVSYRPPTTVGMTMVKGPWFFERLAGGWRFSPEPGGGTRATWRYNFACRPAWLRKIAERIGAAVLGRDINSRIAGYARGCADPVVLAAARELI